MQRALADEGTKSQERALEMAAALNAAQDAEMAAKRAAEKEEDRQRGESRGGRLVYGKRARRAAWRAAHGLAS